MSDQRCYPVIETFGAEPACTVERVESRCRERGRVADVMQPRRRRKYISVRIAERCRHLFGFRTDGLHVRPATRQIFSQARRRHPARTLNERHHDRTLRSRRF
ncbi:hypothetical protein GCM10027610_094990 [Dactylosporangium cerinum]